MTNLLLAGALALTAAPATAIPKGFLLWEKAAATKDDNPETNWSVNRRTGARLTVNPCDKAALASAGRVAARTIVYTSVPDFQKSEQVILFSSADLATQAMAGLRAALRTCATIKSDGPDYRYSGRKAALGDDGLAVTGQSYDGRRAAIGGERAIVARRGNALVLYSQAGEWGKPAAADFAAQTKDAKKILGKICSIASC
ncbi:hypothetical protein [Nonomuraea africana]|uniref:Sensor domain-containing protein n=1 Tax=Nonomuraea africana TaxID=46171 RepID=A0ABR9KGX4_9ACTN|nr:hypothetical protein [Nonomuraea africana]MBE1561041.1 hypothetical protein [Nonomuraea africana]